MAHKLTIKVGVLIEQSGKLLLIKEKRWQDGQYRWNIIKGTFDPKQDEDFFDTAQRETKEEANASIKIKGLLNVLYLQRDNQTLVQFNFTSDLIDSHFAVSDPHQQKKYRIDEKIVEIKLFPRKKLRVMTKKEFVGERTYVSIQAWLKRKRSSLDTIQIVHDY